MVLDSWKRNPFVKSIGIYFNIVLKLFFLSLAINICLIPLLISNVVYAATNEQELRAAISAVASGLNLPVSRVEIEGDFEITSGLGIYGKNIDFFGNGTVTAANSFSDPNMIIIGYQGSLWPGQVTISSGVTFDGNHQARIVEITPGCTFNLSGGSLTNGNSASGGSRGGGVYVSGTFNMSSGSITNNQSPDTSYNYGRGGGVYVYNSSSHLNVSGGTISDNTAGTYKGGGIYIDQGATATINNTIISHNNNVGIYNKGSINISDSTVDYNAGGGRETTYSSTTNMTFSSISHNTGRFGVGVYNYGTFTMNSGSISHNVSTTGSNAFGGGVSNNSGATFTMKSGSISYNQTINSGGGVYNGGVFIMSGGTITNNQTTHSQGDGGGVTNGGTFSMKGGSISNNTAAKGKGFYQYPGNDYHFNMWNDAVIGDGTEANDDIHLGGAGAYIALAEQFSLTKPLTIISTPAPALDQVIAINESSTITDGTPFDMTTAYGSLYNGNPFFKVVGWDDLDNTRRNNKILNGNSIALNEELKKLGDFNDDDAVDLTDVILVLQVMSGIDPVTSINSANSIDADSKVGIKDAIYILRDVSGE